MVLSFACSLLLCLQGEAAAPVEGQVLTISGKTADGVEVFFSPDAFQQTDGTIPIWGRTTTDLAGRFRLDAPDLSKIKGGVFSGTIWAYKPGEAIATADWYPALKEPIVLRLKEESKQVVRIVDRSGKSVEGVRLARGSATAPRGRGGKVVNIPDALGERMSGTTDSEGRAEVHGPAETNAASFLRIFSPELGSQFILLTPGRDGSAAEGVLERAGSLSGKVTRADGGAVDGLELSLQAQYNAGGRSMPVGPPGGPIRVAGDGTFRTPDCLLAGVRYRVTFRGAGVVPGMTVAIEGAGPGKVAEWPPVTLGTTHAVSGRVIDRQGRPITDAEVIQSGDGPEPTTARTDAQGRFTLGGFEDRAALISAHAAGFRYGGRVVSAKENDIVLTRTTERPERAMPRVPPPIGREEMRTIARKLLAHGLDDPKADDQTKSRAVVNLLYVDPTEAAALYAKLGRSEEAFALRLLAPALFRAGQEGADAYLNAIKDPRNRAVALLAIHDSLPRGLDARKRAILERLTVLANTAAGEQGLSVWMRGEIAERMVEAGQVERAREIFAETLKAAFPLGKGDEERILCAISLSRLDPATALGMVQEIPDKARRLTALNNVAVRVAESRPESYDRVAEAIEAENSYPPSHMAIERMSRTDPEHARKLVDAVPANRGRVIDRLSLALGIAGTSKEEAERLFHESIDEADAARGSTGYQLSVEDIDLVEAIGPELVPEFIWFASSRRADRFINRLPDVQNTLESRFVAAISRYDRDVAVAIFAPILERAKAMKPEEMNSLRDDFFQAIAQLDPDKIVAWIESLPKDPLRPGMQSARDRAALSVAEFYGRLAMGSRPKLLPGMITMYDQITRRDALR